jgi:hypothetical protein
MTGKERKEWKFIKATKRGKKIIFCLLKLIECLCSTEKSRSLTLHISDLIYFLKKLRKISQLDMRRSLI